MFKKPCFKYIFSPTEKKVSFSRAYALGASGIDLRMETFNDKTAKLQDFCPIDYKSSLNSEQFKAVTAEPGPALVLAGAGSGKTRALTYRVAWLLEQGVRPWNILLLTFTNKAAREMVHRVEDLTGIEKGQFWGGTFHSIGQRILRIHGESLGLERNFTIMDQGEAETFLKDTITGLDGSFLKDKENPKAKVISGIISLARNMQSGLKETIETRFSGFKNQADSIGDFFEAYTKRKRAQQLVDFDDLLVLWLDLLRNDSVAAAYCQGKFQHLLVDEYQDTNKVQADIVDMIGEHHRIMAVGDDAQCIYTWRGASYDNIMNFPDRHPGTEIYKIETNYRSTPQILGLANSVLGAQSINPAYRKELRSVRERREIPYLLQVMDGRQQARVIIRRVDALIEEGLRLSDIAILYRAHYQALDLQIELSRQGIPFVITSGVRFFEQAHIRDLVAQLRFIVNPGDIAAFSRFTCLLPKVGEKTAAKLFKKLHQIVLNEKIDFSQALFSKNLNPPAAARENWEDLANTLVEIEAAARTRLPQETVRIAVEGWYESYGRNHFANWTSRQDDLNTLISFAARFEDMNELLAHLMLLSSETGNRSVEMTEDCLRLTTVHQAKGLEYPVVFIIGLADGLFPLRRAIEEDNLEEERRLFYVAVTRARDELYLSYPMIGNQAGGPMRLRPSRFLEEIPEDRYEILQVRPATGW